MIDEKDLGRQKLSKAKASPQKTAQSYRSLRSAYCTNERRVLVKENPKRRGRGCPKKEEDPAFVVSKKRKLGHPKKTKKKSQKHQLESFIFPGGVDDIVEIGTVGGTR